MTRIAMLFVLGIVLLTSCTKPEDEPKFLGIDNIEVTKVTGKEVLLNADARFLNPNKVKIKLKKVDIDIELEGKTIGHIDQDFKLKIPANAEFTVPLNATFNIRELGLLNGIISILGGKKIKVKYKGFIKASVHGYTSTVPVEFYDEVRI